MSCYLTVKQSPPPDPRVTALGCTGALWPAARRPYLPCPSSRRRQQRRRTKSWRRGGGGVPSAFALAWRPDVAAVRHDFLAAVAARSNLGDGGGTGQRRPADSGGGQSAGSDGGLEPHLGLDGPGRAEAMRRLLHGGSPRDDSSIVLRHEGV
jgi:hypothetical protein